MYESIIWVEIKKESEGGFSFIDAYSKQEYLHVNFAKDILNGMHDVMSHINNDLNKGCAFIPY